MDKNTETGKNSFEIISPVEFKGNRGTIFNRAFDGEIFVVKKHRRFLAIICGDNPENKQKILDKENGDPDTTTKDPLDEKIPLHELVEWIKTGKIPKKNLIKKRRQSTCPTTEVISPIAFKNERGATFDRVHEDPNLLLRVKRWKQYLALITGYEDERLARLTGLSLDEIREEISADIMDIRISARQILEYTEKLRGCSRK